jgi:hypothetical protein
MALFPASPSNGATANVNGYQFTFNSTDGAWNRTQSFTGNLAVTTISASGNADVGNLGTVGLITATGNITGGNLIGVFANGTSNVSIPAVNGNVNISSAGNANRLVVTGTGANLTGTLNISGDTTFSGTGQRILGDFSNATLSSRTSFQSKTTDNASDIFILPNGTATSSSWNAWNKSDPTNASYIGLSCSSTAATIYTGASGSGTLLPMTFTVASEAARIDTAKNFMVGRTSYAFLSNVAGCTLYNTGQVINETNGSNVPFLINVFNVGTSSTPLINFYRQGTLTGQINTNNGNTTTYGTSSDYRLKTNPQPLTGSGSFIDALQPKTWTWAGTETTGVGFIAHEVAPLAPAAVSGQKDDVNEDGTPKYQTIGYGSAEFIANMVAELQELRRRVAQLEAAANSNP